MVLGLFGPTTFKNGRKTIPNSRNNSNNSQKRGKCLCLLIKYLVFAVVSLYIGFLVMYAYTNSSNSRTTDEKKIQEVAAGKTGSTGRIRRSSSPQKSSCQFRRYPPHRYFHRKQRPLPSFLAHTEYIHGEFPAMLPLSSTNGDPSAQKLCVNQSEWNKETNRLPFADGTNPSILRLKDNPQLSLPGWGGDDDEGYYLATLCMTNSQCAWKDSSQQIKDFAISQQSEPSTVRTVLLVLDRNFQILEETTIQTLVDAKFGRRIKPQQPPTKHVFALDDARLFTFQTELWVSYREGPNFGYDKQVLNRVHLERGRDQQLQATVKASEVETLCCGRNMALLDNVHTHQLQALTWVDPITVISVDLKHPTTKTTSASTTKRKRRRLSLDDRRQTLSVAKNPFLNRRKLAEKGTKKSDFHGTNGFMVHLPLTNEYLGIGHFHRPPGRDANDYARFGHHYTHAFFTIPDQPPFQLKRLTPELLLPSYAHPDDAEIIQFWSGLERFDDQKLVLSYGINDCEGAVSYVDMGVLEVLLRDVPPGKEVVDLLAPLPSNL
jgi:hypothetical protein